jgi:hypothetical protein
MDITPLAGYHLIGAILSGKRTHTAVPYFVRIDLFRNSLTLAAESECSGSSVQLLTLRGSDMHRRRDAAHFALFFSD